MGSALEFHASAMDAMNSGGSGPLLLDLSESSNIDACGLQILVAVAVEALSRGRFFEVSKASEAVERNLQLAGVGYLLKQPG